MPRKAQSDEENAKTPKPKEQYKIVLSIFDNLYIDFDLVEFYINEETGKRKKLMYERPSQLKKSIQENLGENTDKLACWILSALNIEPSSFAKRILDLPKSYDQQDDEAAVEAAEELLDAEAGEDLL